MKCRTFLDLLDSGKLEGREDAMAHARECESCSKALEQMNLAHEEFRKMQKEEAPPFLHSRIMANVRSAAEEDTVRRWTFWSRNRWAVPALAVFLVILLGGVLITTIFHRGSRLVERDARAKGQYAQNFMPRRTQAPGKGKNLRQDMGKLNDKNSAKPADKDELAPPLLGATPLRKEPALEISPDLSRVRPAEGEAAGVPAPEASAPAEESVPRRSGRSEAVKGVAEKRKKAVLGTSDSTLLADSNGPSRKVLCTLKGSSGVFYAFQAPRDSAPGAGAVWHVKVTSSGGVIVRDEKKRSVPASRVTDLVEAVLELDLNPGTYELRRVG